MRLLARIFYFPLVICLIIDHSSCKHWWERTLASPVVFIPGIAGNQLEARLNKESSQYPDCPLKSDWYRIWMDIWRLLPGGEMDCLAENFQLFYNSTLKRSFPAPGVEFRVPEWGNTESVEYIDPSWMAFVLGNVGIAYADLIRNLRSLGLKSGRGIRGAPYDFRYAPHSRKRFFFKLRGLIEDTYKRNIRRKVVLAAHSMGGIFGMYFLNKQTQAWKDKYIKAFITMGTPWRGTVRMARFYASGHTYANNAFDACKLRDQYRSYETTILLLPQTNPWPADKLLISTPQKNYTIADYDDFFRDINYTIASEIRDTIMKETYITGKMSNHPGVPFYCYYSSNVTTTSHVVYREGEFPDSQPSEVVYGDGDGTVNIESLKACQTLYHDDPRYGHLLTVREFQGIANQDIHNDKAVFEAIKEILTRNVKVLSKTEMKAKRRRQFRKRKMKIW